ncbi:MULTISPECIES: prefoldin subunit beta [unclassified Haladaptatus]|uniref:prefoldin subunit beta n=1 Tax=unclassified Haladaptatus TaxID=2622732 RepID=UPI0023E88743|nr:MULTISPECIES: prefoldin subunit beta [unclassified Haladaptatus]
MQGNLPPEAQEKLEELQGLQQTAQQVATQKQTAESSLQEAKAALEELENVDEDATMYREVGELFIQTTYEEAKENLSDKVDTLEIRVETLTKQEDRVESQFEELQEELQQMLGGGAMGGAGGAQ